jgi:iron-sulfur cluster assembly accessory protein
MFTITEEAASKAKEVLEKEGKADWGLRIFVAGGSCCGPSYGMDLDEKSKDGDEITEKSGLKVFTDKDTFEKLQGMTIDFIDDGQQQGFVIKGDTPPSCGPDAGAAGGGCPSSGCGPSCG